MEYKNDDISAILKAAGAPAGQPDGVTKPEIIIRLSAPVGKEATILLHPTGPNTLHPRKEEVYALLQEHGIVHGINEALIDDLCERSVYYHVFTVARYTPPQKGENGYVEYLFNTAESLAPKLLEDGSADYKNLDYIKTVAKGATLCRRHPPLQGADGTDIFGLPIAGLFGDDPMNPTGKNTHLSPDGTELIASVSGHVRHSFGIVAIEEVLVVDSINNSTGNINFIGDVMVKGDIAPGFVVKATGSIAIKGSVEGAVLEAGHSVNVSGGIAGMEKGSIKAGSDIRCKFIQNCEVIASGNIYADSILLSNVQCSGDLILSGQRAAIVGGQATVCGKVEAKTIGSPRSVATEITVVSTDGPTDEIAQTAKEIAKLGAEIAEILVELSRREAQKKDGLAASSQKKIQDLTTRYNECVKHREEAEATLARLQNNWDKEVKGKHYIACKGTMYANTKIKINGEQILLKDDWSRSRVQVTTDGITISHL